MNESIYKNGKYFEQNPTWHTEDSAWKAKQILKIMKGNKIQPSSVCEVGCGAGEILNQLYFQMPSNVSFAGYEISPQAFELCRQREKDRLRFYLENLTEDGWPNFDIVLAIDVIEHVEDYLGFLRKLRGKGTYKIFHIPLDLSVEALLKSYPILRKREEVGHLHYFTKETAIATLKDAGYEVLDFFYTASGFVAPEKSLRPFLGKTLRKMVYGINKDMAVRLFGEYSLLVLTK